MSEGISISESFDEPTQYVERRLIIGATPRSGSHRLGEVLYRLGLGVPAEYFNENAKRLMSRRFQIQEQAGTAAFAARYLQSLEKFRTRNGVFAVKLFNEHRLDLEKHGLTFPDAFTIVLKRRKKSEQITSFLAMLLTKSPFDSDEKFDILPDPGNLDDKTFRFYAKYFLHNEWRWEKYARKHPCVSFFMEDFFANPEEYLKQIAKMGGFNVSENAFRAAIDYAQSSDRYASHSKVKDQIRREFSDVLKKIAEEYDG